MDRQLRFFGEIKRLIPTHMNPAAEVADITGISRHAAKRLLNGTTALKVNELVLLANHFGISLDRLYSLNKGVIEFHYSNLDLSDLDQYQNYLQRLLAPLKRAAESADSRAIFVADDLPVFHAMQYPLLTYFKLYAWYRDVNRTNDKIGFEAFADELRPRGFESAFAAIVAAYQEIPATEIWTEQTITPILLHLDYYRRLKAFEDEATPFQLMEELSALLKTVQRYAELGKRGIGVRSKLDVVLSPVDPGRGLLYVTHGDQFRVILKLFSINSMWTADADHCAEVKKVLAGTIRKCSTLSGASEIKRNEFFDTLQGAISNQLERWQRPTG